MTIENKTETQEIKRNERTGEAGQGDREYAYWLAAMEGLTDRKKILLHTYMKSAKAVYYIEEMQLRQYQFLNEKDRNTIMQAKKNRDPQKEYALLEKKQIRMYTCFDAGYPQRLTEIGDKPYALYIKGNLPDEICFSVAIVGARKCSPYGEKYAYDFAKVLSESGIQIISGLARGIDGIGQRGALSGRGKTFAVLGNGVDICYPGEHIGLYHDILEQGGGILSEFLPGTRPLPYHFPRRNRIISGLSDLVLVMEAEERSGSLITADLALEQGKDVYALLGTIDSRLSRGCNQLIRQGAGILLSPEMLLEELGISGPAFCEKRVDVKKMLERTEELVYSSVVLSPKNVDRILEETGMLPQQVMEILTSLEMKGLIREVFQNYYIRV